MNTAWLTPESRALLAGPSLEFNIVIIYEDAESGRRAKRFSDKLLRELGEQFRCARNLWSFDVLAITDVRNAAAGIAQAADIVVVSASGERELAPQVEQWLDLWAWLIDGTSPALVALFGNGDGGCAQKIRGVLCALARDKRLEFFPQTTFDVSASVLVGAELKRLASSSRWPSN